MSDKVTVIITIAVVIVILLAIWRYGKLKIRGRVAGAEAELNGETSREIRESSDQSKARQVEARIGGNVLRSNITAVGGDLIQNSQPRALSQNPKNGVRESVEGELEDSEI